MLLCRSSTGARMKHAKSDLLQGTLDLLILRTLASGDMHGWGISQRLQQISAGRAAGQPGIALPGALPPRAAGLDRIVVGRFGEQPAREVLRVDPVGPQAARRGDGELGADYRRGRRVLQHGIAVRERPPQADVRYPMSVLTMFRRLRGSSAPAAFEDRHGRRAPPSSRARDRGADRPRA